MPFPEITTEDAESNDIIIASALTGETDINLSDFTQDSTDGWNAGDGFDIFERGVSSTIPFALADDSAGSFEPDSLGIVGTDDTDPFFGVVDTQNSNNNGPVEASWTFDISGATDPYLSVDLAAMGDFESSDDFVIEVSVDGGAFVTLFEIGVNQSTIQTYELDNGNFAILNDPLVVNGTNTALTNDFETFFNNIPTGGSELVVRLTATANGGSEAFALRDIVVTDGAPSDGTEVIEGSGNGGGEAPLTPETTLIVGDDEHLTVASFNIAGVDNFSTGELADNAEELAEQITLNLGAPDIIALQEVSNAMTVEQLDAIVAAISAEGGPTYSYIFEETTIAGPFGGITAISNAILYNADRVGYVDGSATLLTDVEYGSSFPRFPLLADFTFNGETITLVDIHFKSGSKDRDPDTNGNAADREEQALELNAILDSILDANPDANLIVLGDVNDSKISQPAIDLADDEINNLVGGVEAADDVTIRFGSVIDHIFASDQLAGSAQIDYVHVNADFRFPASDHDPVVASFLFRTEAVVELEIVDYADDLDDVVQISDTLVNAGHLSAYFDASGVEVDKVQVLFDGLNDFSVNIEVDDDGWVSYNFDAVGGLGEDPLANLYEFLTGLTDSGLPLDEDVEVGIHESLFFFSSDEDEDDDDEGHEHGHGNGNGQANGHDSDHDDDDDEEEDEAFFDKDDYGFADVYFGGDWDGEADVVTTSVEDPDDGDNSVLIGVNNRDSYTEQLVGGAGNDILIGGRGNDSLSGGDGGDTYYYREDDGDDTIFDDGEDGTDVLIFGEGIRARDVSFSQDAEDADIWYLHIDDGSGTGSTITLDGSGDDAFGGIDQILFADGSSLTDADNFGMI